MAEEHPTIAGIPRLQAENEQALLRDWMESQKKSGALRSGQIGEAELTEASRRLLSALRGGAVTGQFEDITTALEEIARPHATLGLTTAAGAREHAAWLAVSSETLRRHRLPPQGFRCYLFPVSRMASLAPPTAF
jgi:hypothetical protein